MTIFERVNRRAFLIATPIALLPARSSCAESTNAAPRINPNKQLFIAPNGTVGSPGTSWDSAGVLSQLSEFLSELAESGGEVLLAADRGPFHATEAIEVRPTTTPSHTIVVRGIDSKTGAPMHAEIRGARDDQVGPDRAKGRECFRLHSLASNLSFRNLHFRNIGNGCFRIGEALRNLEIEDCTFDNVYRFLENTAYSGVVDASLDRFRVANCRGTTVERSFARLRYNSANGEFLNCFADSRGVEGDPFAVGCALSDSAHDILFDSCTMENFRQNNGNRYWNGDGFSDELGNYRIQYVDCVARGSTDGGFDCKSASVTLLRCTAEDNKRNFRIWSNGSRLIECVSRNPNWRGRGQERGGPCHAWFGGVANAVINLEHFQAESSDDSVPVIVFGANGVVAQFSGAVMIPSQAPLIWPTREFHGEVRGIP